MERIWNEREKPRPRQHRGMYGEVRGILGQSVPPVPALELEVVAGQLEEVTQRCLNRA
jgi:hypothetical protein